MAFEPVTAGLEFGGKLLDVIKRWIPDPEAQAKAVKEVLDVIAAGDAGQRKINEIEAGESSLFVSGWRPAVGWVCVAGYAYHYILQPFLVFLLVAFNVQFQADHLPQLNIMELSVMLANLLGFGAYRTYEKVKGNGK